MIFIKILKKIFSRMSLMLLLILIEIGAIMTGVVFLLNYWPFFSIELALVHVIVFLMVVNRKGPTELKTPWIITVLLLPILGVLIYAFFANHGLKSKYRKITKEIRNEQKKHFDADPETLKLIKEKETTYSSPFEYLSHSMRYTPSSGNKVRYYSSGEEFFPRFKEELKKAKEFIFLEFFIIDRGKEWNEIHQILVDKAKEGVEVRVIYDDIGCAGLLHSYYPKILKKEGIKCFRFNPFIPLLSGIFNNRDHRKIAIIDHHIAYTGGMNLADEYANDIVRFGYWKDSMIEIQGPAIDNLIYLFLATYDLSRNKSSDYDKYLGYQYERYPENSIVAPFGDGPSPFYGNEVGEATFINMIESAKESIYISTPYFIPTDNLKSAILRAGYRGVDIRILLPGIPDKKPVYKMALRYVNDLVKAGIKVYRYNEGFNHAKMIVVDKKIAFVGTINMDYRSLVHHFECGAIFMNSKAVDDAYDDLLDCFDHGEALTKENTKLSVMSSFMCALLNIFAQML